MDNLCTCLSTTNLRLKASVKSDCIAIPTSPSHFIKAASQRELNKNHSKFPNSFEKNNDNNHI